MNGFMQDYDKLFQQFQAKSRVTYIDSDLTEKLGSSEQAFSSSSQLADSSVKVYNFTFCQFMECFQQLKFSSIFCGHRSTNSLREFYDHINEFLVPKLSSSQPIEIRIFSFYLMYALWFIQKKCYKPSLKIRIDKESFTNLKDLVHYMSKQQQFDIVLAYRKLFLSGAFIFCESIKLYGPYYKNYLAKNSLVTQEMSNHLTAIKNYKNDYVNQLKGFKDNLTQINSDNFLSLMKRFEDNCF